MQNPFLLLRMSAGWRSPPRSASAAPPGTSTSEWPRFKAALALLLLASMKPRVSVHSLQMGAKKVALMVMTRHDTSGNSFCAPLQWSKPNV
jgi:hypothetical protein